VLFLGVSSGGFRLMLGCVGDCLGVVWGGFVVGGVSPCFWGMGFGVFFGVFWVF